MKCPYRNFEDCIVEQCPSCVYEEQKHKVIDGIIPGRMALEKAIEVGYASESERSTYKFISCKLIDNSVQPVPANKQVINNTTKTNVVVRKSVFQVMEFSFYQEKNMKVVEFIKKLEKLGYTEETELSFGFCNGCMGEYFECEIMSIDDEDRQCGVNALTVEFFKPEEYVQSEVEIANFDFKSKLIDLLSTY